MILFTYIYDKTSLYFKNTKITLVTFEICIFVGLEETLGERADGFAESVASEQVLLEIIIALPLI
jgi:hypothetical protein